VGIVCFGEFESGSGKPTLGGAKEELPGRLNVALVEVAVPSLEQPFELRESWRFLLNCGSFLFRGQSCDHWRRRAGPGNTGLPPSVLDLRRFG
jgi:hypothetical protein